MCSHAISYSPPSNAVSAAENFTTSSCHGTFFIVRLSLSFSLEPQKVTALISMKSGSPNATSSAYCFKVSSSSAMLYSFTSVKRYTVRWRLLWMALKESMNRSQKSLNSGRSVFFKVSAFPASTDTYSCVTGFKLVMAPGNWALVTKKVEILLACSSVINSLICGYMMGSPTRLRAQCLTVMAALWASSVTPGTPLSCLIKFVCKSTASRTIWSAGSISHFQLVPTGFLWWRQQNTHLLAQARDGVASIQFIDEMP